MLKPKKMVFKSRGREIIVGVCISLIIQNSLCGFIAWMVLSERLKENIDMHASMVILTLSSFAGSIIAVNRNERGRMVKSVLFGLIYVAVLMLMNCVFFRDGITGVGKGSMLIMAGCISSALIYWKNYKTGSNIKHF